MTTIGVPQVLEFNVPEEKGKIGYRQYSFYYSEPIRIVGAFGKEWKSPLFVTPEKYITMQSNEGIYSYNNRHLLKNAHIYKTLSTLAVSFYAKCLVYGKVVTHESGYRSSRCKVLGVYAPTKNSMAFPDNYVGFYFESVTEKVSKLWEVPILALSF